MKVQRFSLAVLVVLGLVAAAGAAWGYTLENELALDRVSQIVNLRGASTTGQINFADLLRVMPDGTQVPFTIPSGRVLVMTRVYFDLKTASTDSWAMLNFEPFLTPAASNAVVSGTTSSSRIFGSGCPIGPPSPTSPLYRLRALNPSGTTISGDLNVSITGFIMNPKATMAPINYLLLLE